MSSVYVTSSIIPVSPHVYREDFHLLPKTQAEIDLAYRWYQEPDDMWVYDAGIFGRITILNRQTGFMDCRRDTETGFRDRRLPRECDFWLASGMFDIRQYIPQEGICFNELVKKVKKYSNAVVGGLPSGRCENCGQQLDREFKPETKRCGEICQECQDDQDSE